MKFDLFPFLGILMFVVGSIGLIYTALDPGKDITIPCYDSHHNEIKDIKCNSYENIKYQGIFFLLSVSGMFLLFVYVFGNLMFKGRIL